MSGSGVPAECRDPGSQVCQAVDVDRRNRAVEWWVNFQVWLLVDKVREGKGISVHVRQTPGSGSTILRTGQWGTIECRWPKCHAIVEIYGVFTFINQLVMF
jgi:hypothetical protein